MSGRGTYSSRWGRPVYLLSSLLCVICLPLWLLGKIAGLWLVLAVLLRVLLIPLGSLVAASGIFGRVLLFGPTDKPLVALTFDDGPDPHQPRRVPHGRRGPAASPAPTCCWASAPCCSTHRDGWADGTRGRRRLVQPNDWCVSSRRRSR